MQDRNSIETTDRRQKQSLMITGVWLRRIGDDVEVLIERVVDGQRKWFKAISEHHEGAFSHIAESEGACTWPEVEFSEVAAESV